MQVGLGLLLTSTLSSALSGVYRVCRFCDHGAGVYVKGPRAEYFEYIQMGWSASSLIESESHPTCSELAMFLHLKHQCADNTSSYYLLSACALRPKGAANRSTIMVMHGMHLGARIMVAAQAQHVSVNLILLFQPRFTAVFSTGLVSDIISLL